MRKDLTLDTYISKEFNGIENVNATVDALHGGNCLRAVLHINEVVYKKQIENY